jgi:hypothetical protein
MIEAITRTEVTTDTVTSNPRSRKRRGIFGVPMTWRSGVRITAPWARSERMQNFHESKEDATTTNADAAEAPVS